jgi:hypothetical protein
MKMVCIEEEEVKLSLFADNMILYLEGPKNSMKRLVGLPKFIKVTGHKVNV